jgi:hypothetical protein
MTRKMMFGAAVMMAMAAPVMAQDAKTSFFITSVNPGDGANLGGLEGADAHCATLAEAAGITGKVWAAYLSSSAENARDRIGSGPWYNYDGVEVASDIDALHAQEDGLSKVNSTSESGEVINGRGDAPNRHDILTGSDLQGVLVGNACEDWTSSAEDGSAMVGHHDRTGGGANPTSWNAAHGSRGCSLENLRGTGGDGLFYCFATN